MKTYLTAFILLLAIPMCVHGEGATNMGSDLCFDVTYYLEKQADVNRFYHGDKKMALNHWLGDGINQGREASPVFNVRYYISKYPDVPKEFRKAVEHWLTVGVEEGRQGTENFDVKVYITSLKSRGTGMKYAQAMRHYLALPANKRVAYIEAPAGGKEAMRPLNAPILLKGKFYADIDDMGTISVNGEVVHKGGLGHSQSKEVEINVGDRLVLQLTNVDLQRHCAILFVSSDKRYIISFAARHLKVLSDPDKNDFDPAEIARSGKLAKEVKKVKPSFPFRNSSEFVWGEADVCGLGCVISKDMIVPLKLQ